MAADFKIFGRKAHGERGREPMGAGRGESETYEVCAQSFRDGGMIWRWRGRDGELQFVEQLKTDHSAAH